MKENNRYILLTFDVEEFDLPIQHKLSISLQEQMATGKQGLDNISGMLANNINATLFTTANFALKYPAAIASLCQEHEIASHTFFHSSFSKEDLVNSKQVLEDITSKKVHGLRMPGLKKLEGGWIRESGYKYDSGANSITAGLDNNSFCKDRRTVYFDNGIVRLPSSVSLSRRVPLSWIALKNLPYAYFKKLALYSLKKDNYLSLYFHTWEFADLYQYNLPFTIIKKTGLQLLEKLKHLLTDLKHEAEFVTMQNFLEL